MLTDEYNDFEREIEEEIAWWILWGIVILAMVCGLIKIGVVK